MSANVDFKDLSGNCLKTFLKKIHGQTLKRGLNKPSTT
jgi:hypothetical protein